jgi:hypothetical protein
MERMSGHGRSTRIIARDEMSQKRVLFSESRNSEEVHATESIPDSRTHLPIGTAYAARCGASRLSGSGCQTCGALRTVGGYRCGPLCPVLPFESS